MKIVADMQIPFLHGALERYAEVVYLDGVAIDSHVVHDADALLVRTRTLCNQKLLGESQVKFVGTATIGMDHIDKLWCTSQGITVESALGCNANGVANYIVTALLEISVKHGIPLQDKVLGVVGVGEVGSRVCQYGKALGMNVLCNDPPRAEKEGRHGFHALHRLQKEADFLTFHVPLEKQGAHPTWRMVNGSFLSKLSPQTWLLNTSRGSVVDNTSLRIALRSSSLAGAVLDVWEGEPDGIDVALMSLVELATPHIAGYSMEGKANATTQIVQKLAKTLQIPELLQWEVPVDALGATPKPLCIDATGKNEEECLLEAIRQVYTIQDDDADLRADVSRFESMRNAYDFRREFPAFQVQLINAQASLRTKFLRLGFQV